MQIEQLYLMMMKHIFERASEFLINSNLWVASGLTALACFCMKILGMNLEFMPILLCFSSALLVYNFDRLIDSRYEIRPDTSEQEFYTSSKLSILLFIGVLGVLVSILSMPRDVKLMIAIYIGVGLIYGLPIFNNSTNKNNDESQVHRLKDIRGIKAWLAAAVITSPAVGLPIAYSENIDLDWNSVPLIIFIYILVASNAHMFDIRDLDSDREKGLKTLPVLVGIAQTKNIIISLNLLTISMALIGGYLGFCSFWPEVILSTLYTLSYIFYFDDRNSRVMYALVIDGVLFLPLLFLYVHEAINILL
jgi:4-hydroxybenzoate polyprenyltransferase